MLRPLNGLDHGQLVRTVEEQYGGVEQALEFVPLGEDSWSYRLGHLWVSVRRDLRGHVPAAYEAAALLHRSGLDFVLAPLAGKDGQVVRRIGAFPVVVFPYIVVSPLPDSAPSRRDMACVVEMLSRVHRATIAAELPTETYELPFADDLDRALAVPDAAPRESGPYGARLHRLLCAHRQHIAALRAEFEELGAACAAAAGTPVLTHGEPIASNILRYHDRLLVADWGEAMWGPPERDWSHVTRTIGGDPPCRPEFRRLYDIRWVLSEIAEYTSVFLDLHTGDADNDAMWKRLVRYLPEDR